MLKGKVGAWKGKAALSPAQLWSLSPQLLFLKCAEMFALVGTMTTWTDVEA